MNMHELNEREKAIYRAGYKQGQDDFITILGAYTQLSSAERERADPLEVAERALRGSKMTITKGQ